MTFQTIRAPSPSVSDRSRAGCNNEDDSSNEGIVVDAENPIYGDLKPPKKRNAQRAGNRRPGRPRGTGKKRDGITTRKM